MKRKPWTYKDCKMEPATGPTRYFGHRNFTPDCKLPLYRTTWWKVTFPDNTYCLCATKEDCRIYIDTHIDDHQGPPSSPQFITPDCGKAAV